MNARIIDRPQRLITHGFSMPRVYIFLNNRPANLTFVISYVSRKKFIHRQ